MEPGTSNQASDAASSPAMRCGPGRRPRVARACVACQHKKQKVNFHLCSIFDLNTMYSVMVEARHVETASRQKEVSLTLSRG